MTPDALSERIQAYIRVIYDEVDDSVSQRLLTLKLYELVICPQFGHSWKAGLFTSFRICARCGLKERTGL